MTDNRYGVMALVLEFIVSLVVLTGGGFLLYEGKAEVLAASAIGAVITFWFQRRQNEQFINQLQQQQVIQSVQQPAAQTPQPAPIAPSQEQPQPQQNNLKQFGG